MIYLCLLQLGQCMLQSIQRLFQILHGIGIGDSDLPGDIVRLTGHCGDQRLIQKIASMVMGIVPELEFVATVLTQMGIISLHIPR